VPLAPVTLVGEFPLSVYQIARMNEIGFSFSTVRYVNVGRSRRRGVAASVHARAIFLRLGLRTAF
jgi:hypothetical protein